MKHDLVILTAPPASGKTHFIGTLKDELSEEPLIISPLRALVDECKRKWGEDCLVMTPEKWNSKKNFGNVVIFDEFHLHFYWGDTFRPIMWEVFFELSQKAELIILLTATFSKEMLDEVTHFKNHFDSILWVDHGNQTLKNPPRKYYQAYSRAWISEMLMILPWKGKGHLIFCAYRSEVLDWEKKLISLGYTVWICLGGEAALFSNKVRNERPPDFIVATTVLSHGVNLPTISHVFFTYKVKNIDFWIQMVARGGRRGEAFEVYSLEKPSGIKWNPILNILAIAGISIKIKWYKIIGQIEEWFLKV